MNQDRFGNPIKNGDIVFYITSSKWGNERIGKVVVQTKGRLGMMSERCSCSEGAQYPIGTPARDSFEEFFRAERRWYPSDNCIVITSIVPKCLIEKLDEAYDNWRKKNGNKKF